LKDDDDHQKQAAYNRLPVSRKTDPPQAVFEVEEVENQAQKQNARQRCNNRALAAGQQCSTHND